MKRIGFALFCIGTLSLPLLSQPEAKVADKQPPLRNPRVDKIISEISASHIKSLVEKLVSFGTRHTLSDTVSSTRGIGAARRWIKSELEKYASTSGGRMRVEFQESVVQPSSRIPAPASVVNVVARLDPRNQDSESAKRLLVVGAHYDSRASNPVDAVGEAPGANDDGSGTAVVLELARVLSRYDFDATIVFIAFAGEEQGLLGATQWAEMAVQYGWNIEAVLNNDMVGNIRAGDGAVESTYVRLYAEALSPLDTGSTLRVRNSLGQENDGPSRTLARYVKEIGERYVPNFKVKMIYRRDRFFRGGDHSPFHDRGFAAVRIVDAKESYDHQHQDPRIVAGKQYGDLPEFMNFEYAAKNARINAAVLAALASAPMPPANVGIVTAQLGYATQIRWDANRESDLAGYFVRYRETTSPMWEQAVFTTDTSITFSLSKDDLLFGVQAVDKEGNASLVVLPRPVR